MVSKETRFLKGPVFFILPAFAIYCVFLIVPLLGTLFFSLSSWTGYSFADLKLTGPGNYLLLFKDSIYLQSLKNSLLAFVVVVAGQITLGLGLAILLERKVFLGSFFRGTFFLPSVISLVVTGIVFSILLDPSLKIFNPLMQFVGLGQIAKVWLSNPRVALTMVLLIQIWYGFGVAMFIYIAAIKGINPQLYEASEIDGASEWGKVIRITIPLLKNATAIAIITSGMRGISIFEISYVMTKGGPFHATEFLATWGFYQGLSYGRVGYGSAVSVSLVLLSAIIGVFLIKYWNVQEALQE
jgi:raffinose/stachyose/melibiose transport system permease protein